MYEKSQKIKNEVKDKMKDESMGMHPTYLCSEQLRHFIDFKDGSKICVETGEKH